jgi:hypothetical protein
MLRSFFLGALGDILFKVIFLVVRRHVARLKAEFE